jgi:hypothetical protein
MSLELAPDSLVASIVTPLVGTYIGKYIKSPGRRVANTLDVELKSVYLSVRLPVFVAGAAAYK